MISKAQSKVLTVQPSILAKPPKLHTLEKSMLTWAVLDPDDRVLDASCKDGLLLDYIERYIDCEVCGASDQMEAVRSARARLRLADIVYATLGDIPWHDGKFDAVFFDAIGRSEAELKRAFCEIFRVLKGGGQLLLGTKWQPSVLRAIAALLLDSESLAGLGKKQLLGLLQDTGYEHCVWHQAGLKHGVITCWKPHADNK